MNEDTRKAREIVKKINAQLIKDFKALNLYHRILETISQVKKIQKNAPRYAGFEKYFSYQDLLRLELICQYEGTLTNSICDLHVDSKNILLFSEDWERRYSARKIHVTIHETIVAIGDRKKQLRDWVFEIGNPETVQLLEAINLNFKSFSKKHDLKSLSDKRHQIGAHIPKDFFHFYTLTNDLDLDEVFELVEDFLAILYFYKGLLSELNKKGTVNKPFHPSEYDVWKKLLELLNSK